MGIITSKYKETIDNSWFQKSLLVFVVKKSYKKDNKRLITITREGEFYKPNFRTNKRKWDKCNQCKFNKIYPLAVNSKMIIKKPDTESMQR